MTEKTARKLYIALLLFVATLVIFTAVLTLYLTNSLRIEQNQHSSVVVNTNSINDKIDLNNTTKEELETIPGIGETLAKKIVENKPYDNLHKLKTIPGISYKKFESIKKYLKVGD